jgi:hypothetical protein
VCTGLEDESVGRENVAEDGGAFGESRHLLLGGHSLSDRSGGTNDCSPRGQTS